MSGSIAMSAMAALRCGSGLVTAAVPDRCLETVAAFHPCVMTLPLPDDGNGRFSLEASPRWPSKLLGSGGDRMWSRDDDGAWFASDRRTLAACSSRFPACSMPMRSTCWQHLIGPTAASHRADRADAPSRANCKG